MTRAVTTYLQPAIPHLRNEVQPVADQAERRRGEEPAALAPPQEQPHRLTGDYPAPYSRPAAAFNNAITLSFFARASDNTNATMSMFPFTSAVVSTRIGALDS